MRAGRILRMAGNKILRTKRRLVVRFGVKAPTFTAYTRNISETGLYLETSHALPPGTDLQLEIETPGRKFEMWAVVVWARVYPPQFQHLLRGAIGCRFEHPSEEWLEFYRRWKDET